MPRLKIPKARTAEVPARIWKRAVALLIDLLILDVIILFPFEGYFRSLVPSAGLSYLISNPPTVIVPPYVVIMMSLLSVLYFSISGFKTNTTIGKYIMKIKTRSTEKKSSFWQFFVASLTFTPVYLLWIIDFVHLVLSKNKQRLLERIARLESVEEVTVE